MKGAILKLTLAATICLMPFLLVWKLAGREGFVVFLIIVGGFAVGCAGLCAVHWAIETVLVALGFDRNKINESNGNTIIFWGGDR